MENSNGMDTGIMIESIILVENSFQRINNVTFDAKVENNINLNVEVKVDGSTIIVAETVSLDQKFQGEDQVNVMVKMVGVFKVVGATEINNLEEFGNVNGAAIIFPYIREHITNQSLKAGIGAIMLPPVNFTKPQNK